MRGSFRVATLGLMSLVGCHAARSPASTRSDRWTFLFHRGGIAAYIDTSSAVDSGSVTRVWLRFDYDEALPKMESTTGPYIRTDAQEDINCRERRARDVALKMIDSTSKVVGDTLWGPGPWLSFDAHPLGTHILEPACEHLGRGGPAA